MKTILLENIDLNEIREAMREGDEFNTPVSILRDTVDTFSKQLTEKAELKPIVDTIVFQTFSVWAIEFFKNALDAKASNLTLEFKFDKENDKLEILIRDDGTTPIPPEKLGEYRWQTPFEVASHKASQMSKDSAPMGGAHLGLARFAHILEKYCNKGEMTLKQREDQPGAEVTLTGAATGWEKDVQDEDFNAQYMREMGEDFRATPGAVGATTKVTERLKGDVTGLGHLSSNDQSPSPILTSPPSMRGKKTPSPTTIQTPTTQVWSPNSPHFVDPGKGNAGESFRFFNTPTKKEKIHISRPSPKKSPPKPPK